MSGHQDIRTSGNKRSTSLHRLEKRRWRGLRAGWRGLRASQQGLRASQQGLKASQQGLRANQRGVDVRTDGRKDGWTDRCTEFLSILQDFVHGWGRCPKSKKESAGERRGKNPFSKGTEEVTSKKRG